MRKYYLVPCIMVIAFAAAIIASAEVNRKGPSSCEVCGMNTDSYPQSRMLLEYDDKTSASVCSIRCAAALMAAHREKAISAMSVADFHTRELIDAKKAFWVIGGKKPGAMTGVPKWAFLKKSDAERFVKENGGRLSAYDDAMKAAFSGMYDDLKMLRETAKATHISLDDIARHPECIYCGMDRNKYWYSRMLVEYEDGRVVGTCSIHCTAIDFSVNPDRVPKAVMVGDYNTKKLINAEKALWVVGGTRQGVMSIRGKWAFGEKAAAENFVKENGGRQGSFDEAVKAAFEDMYEILR